MGEVFETYYNPDNSLLIVIYKNGAVQTYIVDPINGARVVVPKKDGEE